MYRFATIAAFIFALPLISVAQTSGPDSGSVQGLAAGLLLLINSYLIPFLISLAVLFFIYNVVRYFILQSHDVEDRAAARQLALWGITALAFIMAFWGIIFFTIQGFGIQPDENCIPAPDFVVGGGVFCDNPPGTVTIPPTQPDPIDPDPGPDLPDPDEPPDRWEPDPIPDPEDPDQPPGTPPLSSMIEGDIWQMTRSFFTETQPQRLGDDNATALLADGYFADLHVDGRENYNDLERLQAVYRLNQLGEVDTGTLDDYLSAVNQEREDGSLSPITASEVADSISIPTDQQPSFVSEERSEIGSQIRSGLEDYNDLVPPNERLSESQINNLVNNVTDPGESYAIRRQRMEALLGENPDGTIYLQSGTGTDRGPDRDLENKLYNYLNTERLYDGDFTEFF